MNQQACEWLKVAGVSLLEEILNYAIPSNGTDFLTLVLFCSFSDFFNNVGHFLVFFGRKYKNLLLLRSESL